MKTLFFIILVSFLGCSNPSPVSRAAYIPDPTTECVIYAESYGVRADWDSIPSGLSMNVGSDTVTSNVVRFLPTDLGKVLSIDSAYLCTTYNPDIRTFLSEAITEYISPNQVRVAKKARYTVTNQNGSIGTDNTAAIQAAMDAATACGGTLRFSNSNGRPYLFRRRASGPNVSAAVRIAGAVTIEGAGIGRTVFRRMDADTQNFSRLFYVNAGVKGVTFRNFSVNGARKTQVDPISKVSASPEHHDIIFIDAARNVLIESIEFFENVSDFIYAFQRPNYITIRDCIFRKSNRAAISAHTAQNFLITGCTFINNGNNGIKVEQNEPTYDTHSVTVTNNKFIFDTLDVLREIPGVNLNSIGTGITLNGLKRNGQPTLRDWIITGNTFSGLAYGVFGFHNVRNVLVSNNTFNNCVRAVSPNSYGIPSKPICDNVVIQGNVAYDMRKYYDANYGTPFGVYYARNLIFRDNIYQTRHDSVSAPKFWECEKVIFEGNIIGDSLRTPVTFGRCKEVYARNNRISYNLTNLPSMRGAFVFSTFPYLGDTFPLTMGQVDGNIVSGKYFYLVERGINIDPACVVLGQNTTLHAPITAILK